MKEASGLSRGFAFVTYEDTRVLDRVVLDKHIIDGKQVNNNLESICLFNVC